MSNRLNPRPQRYSRPPSLLTISSDEEADFSSHRQNRRTFQTHYTVSPLEEEYSIPHYQPHPPVSGEHGLQPDQWNSRAAPPYLPAYQGQQNARTYTDDYLIGASDEEKGGLDYEPAKPKSAFTKHFFIIPEMERAETGFSDDSSSSYTQEAPKKYMKTRFMWMLLQLDQIPWWHNLLAAASSWIVLAAYLVVPGTFTSVSKNNQNFDPKNVTSTPAGQFDAVTHQIIDTVNVSIQHLGLFIFSAILAGVGVLMCLLLFFLHWQNYVWLSWKIFQPMTLNALAGLLTTVVNVMTAQKGHWSATAKINAIVSGTVAVIAGGFFILYNFFLIEGVRKQHRKHFPVDAELVDPIHKHRIERYLPAQKGF